MFYYQAPNMGGFSGAVSYSLDENTTAAAVTSMNLTYGAGPVAIQFAYQTEDIANTVALPSDKKFARLGGSYDLGMAKAKLSYGEASNLSNQDGADATEWHVGVDVPVSSALTLSAGYATSSDNAKAGDNDRDGFSVAASYSLSKRTFLYGGYHQSKQDFKAAATPDTKTSIFAVGLQHRF
jgi:predicted porin